MYDTRVSSWLADIFRLWECECVRVCMDLPLALRTHCEWGRIHISSPVMLFKECGRLVTHFSSFILTYAYEWLECLGLRYTDNEKIFLSLWRLSAWCAILVHLLPPLAVIVCAFGKERIYYLWRSHAGTLLALQACDRAARFTSY